MFVAATSPGHAAYHSATLTIMGAFKAILITAAVAAGLWILSAGVCDASLRAGQGCL